jgi:hypothetical protein
VEVEGDVIRSRRGALPEGNSPIIITDDTHDTEEEGSAGDIEEVLNPNPNQTLSFKEYKEVTNVSEDILITSRLA